MAAIRRQTCSGGRCSSGVDGLIDCAVLGPNKEVKETRDGMVSTKGKVRARVRPLPHREHEYTVVSGGSVGRGRTHRPRGLGGWR